MTQENKYGSRQSIGNVADHVQTHRDLQIQIIDRDE
jgi:hypothetical protein